MGTLLGIGILIAVVIWFANSKGGPRMGIAIAAGVVAASGDERNPSSAAQPASLALSLLCVAGAAERVARHVRLPHSRVGFR